MPPTTRLRTAKPVVEVLKTSTPCQTAKKAEKPKLLAKSPQKSLLIDSRAAVEEASARKRRKVEPNVKLEPPLHSVTPRVHYQPSVLPVEPQFDVAAGLDHLIAHDPRFRGLFDAMACRPFIQPFQALDPFRTLTTSIVGQQVSWMAAKAINNRFKGLFGYLPDDEEGFPSPADVVAKDVLVLKSAGLSLRKAEYVKSLAEHFLSGGLSTELLRHGTDDEITKALIAVRGIGQWTVDMFLIFSLRRPNILPYTDLGVQKGLLRFALSAHDAFPDKKGKFQLSKKKDDKAAREKVAAAKEESATGVQDDRATPPPRPATGMPPTPHTPSMQTVKRGGLHTPNAPGGSQLPPTPLSPGPREMLVVQHAELPTPAPEDLLAPTAGPAWDAHRVAPLEAGLTVELMKSRWSGKKAKGGAYLTPAEMEVLTAGWAPYRSMGVYYTWAIADGGEA